MNMGEWDKQPLLFEGIKNRIGGAERVNTYSRTVNLVFHSSFQTLSVATALQETGYPMSQALYIRKLYKKPHAGLGLMFDVDTAHLGC